LRHETPPKENITILTGNGKKKHNKTYPRNSSRKGAEEKALRQRLRRDFSAIFHAKDAETQRTQREEGKGYCS